WSGMYLSRAQDAAGRVVVLLLPLRDPARQAADGDADGEHARRNADAPQHDAAVEVDIGIELALDEIRVREGEFLQAPGNVEEWIVVLETAQHLVAEAFQHLRTCVEIAIDAIPEAEQTERAGFVL